MLDGMLLAVLALALLVPPIVLFKTAGRLSWLMRYVLSALPLAYTGLGWQFGRLAHTFMNCAGNAKDIHDCVRWGIDFTAMVGHASFLMIPCLLIALPLSLWLLLDTAAKHIGARRQEQSASRR